MVATYLRRAYSIFFVHVLDVPLRLLAFLFFLLLLFLPLARLSIFNLGILVVANIFAVLAASWDLLAGRTGQVSLGHSLFFGVGAYTSALIFKYFRFPIWATIPLAVVIGFSVALFVGFPSLRLKGPYLALVTLAFPIILMSLTYYFSDITGGERGIRDLPPLFSSNNVYQARLGEYYITLLLLLAASVVLYKVANSKTGIVLVSILDDELASKASGINVTKYKLMAFAISGSIASLTGGIYAHFLTIANPPVFGLDISFFPIIMTVLGGIGTIYGPLVGAYIFHILDRYVLNIMIPIPPELEQAKLLIFTLVVIILIIKWPRGIARWVVDKLQDLQEARELEEIRKEGKPLI